MKITADLLADFARYNTGVARAREAYAHHDVPMFDDCLEPRCGPSITCHACRRRARGLLTVATSPEECADLLAIIDRPGVRVLMPCGTIAAYRRHQRHHEKPCLTCRLAYNAYVRRQR